MMPLRVGLVQLDAGSDVGRNRDRALELALEATERLLTVQPDGGRSEDAVRLVGLPETFLYRGPTEGHRASAEQVPGPTTELFGDLAARTGTWLLLGSLAERSRDAARPYNTSVLLAPDGTIAATYRKIHLFDVTIDDGPSDRESDRALAGDRAVVTDLAAPARSEAAPAAAADAAPPSPARLGLSICYDVRFPELYRTLALAGATLLAVPANFTARTGRDHWETLLRARAIENGAFVIAPAQCGDGGGVAIPAHGHSMVVDPWGTILAEAGTHEGIVTADLDLDRVSAVRRQIPSLANRRPDVFRL